jgi:type IV pilus assembly protein PilM
MPIAVDFGASSIKMLQLAGGPDQCRVAAAGRYDLAPDLPAEGPERQAVLVEGCRELLSTFPFRGRDVVVGLPDSIVQYKSVRMPMMPESELAQAVAWESGDRFQLGGVKATLQHLVAGEVRQGDEARQEVILMAAADEKIEYHLHVLRESKLSPLALEPTPVAMARCIARLFRRQADQQVVRAVVDIGAAGSKIVILKGHQIAFYRRIEIGGHTLCKTLAERLQIATSDAIEVRRQIACGAVEAADDSKPLFGSARRQDLERAVYDATRTVMSDLAKEIGLCLRYYSVTFRGARPDGLLLCGGESGDPRLCQFLGEQLELKAIQADVLFGVDAGAAHVLMERRGTQSQWAVATGLALRRSAVAAPSVRGAA